MDFVILELNETLKKLQNMFGKKIKSLPMVHLTSLQYYFQREKFNIIYRLNNYSINGKIIIIHKWETVSEKTFPFKNVDKCVFTIIMYQLLYILYVYIYCSTKMPYSYFDLFFKQALCNNQYYTVVVVYKFVPPVSWLSTTPSVSCLVKWGLAFNDGETIMFF